MALYNMNLRLTLFLKEIFFKKRMLLSFFSCSVSFCSKLDGDLRKTIEVIGHRLFYGIAQCQ